MSSPRSRSSWRARWKVTSSISGSVEAGQALLASDHAAQVGLVIEDQLHEAGVHGNLLGQAVGPRWDYPDEFPAYRPATSKPRENRASTLRRTSERRLARPLSGIASDAWPRSTGRS